MKLSATARHSGVSN